MTPEEALQHEWILSVSVSLCGLSGQHCEAGQCVGESSDAQDAVLCLSQGDRVAGHMTLFAGHMT